MIGAFFFLLFGVFLSATVARALRTGRVHSRFGTTLRSATPFSFYLDVGTYAFGAAISLGWAIVKLC